jgi:hypothetical protein
MLAQPSAQSSQAKLYPMHPRRGRPLWVDVVRKSTTLSNAKEDGPFPTPVV